MSLPSELIARAKAGCRNSRGQLFEQHRDYLKTLARVQQHAGLLSKSDASDLVQEVFLRAHEVFDAFAGTTEGQFLVWLRRILATRLIDGYRFHTSRKRNVGVEQNINDLLTQSSVALCNVAVQPGPSPSAAVSNRENARLVATAIENLPPDYRTVILLRNVRGLRYAEVAAEMQRSIDSVKKLWVRALAQLQRSVESHP